MTYIALPGMLTYAEVDCLYQLGQFNQREGAIVEIGSWKGKSTIALALGAAKDYTKKRSTPLTRTRFFPKKNISKIPRQSFTPTSNRLASTVE